MPQVINMNIASLNAQRNLNQSQSALQTSLQRLSSGLRINSAKDDAAGLAISERFTSQIRGLNQASRNANDAISLSQTAEGALGEITNNLQRIRELAVQSANATNSSTDRAALQNEVSQLVSEIDRVASQTSFNGVKLLDGTFNSQAFQVGANAGETISISSITSSRATDLGMSYSATTTSASGVNTTATDGSNVSINGVGIVASVSDGVSFTNSTSSAKAKAAAINATSGTGVVATANATAVAGTSMVTAATTGAMTINNIATASITTGGGTLAQDRAAVTAAINAISAATGVIATDTGVDATGVTLGAADGRNVTTSFGGTLTAAATGLGAAATTTGKVTLTSQGSTGITIGGTAAILGTPASVAASQTGTALSVVNVGSVAGANTAINSVDAALATVNSSRATLGSYQNRFTSTIANLQTAAENLSASRSRIQDADFAAESAQLTRGQILQQAGTAMLAQANALPNNVLSLLRG